MKKSFDVLKHGSQCTKQDALVGSTYCYSICEYFCGTEVSNGKMPNIRCLVEKCRHNKIYLHKNAEYRLRYVKDGVTHRIYSEPPKEDRETYIEYTNLSSAWHDARKERNPQGMSVNNAVIVVGLCNGRLSYRHVWNLGTNMENCWQDIELLANSNVYDKVLWAYLIDLVP